jgi:hypothetical protein
MTEAFNETYDDGQPEHQFSVDRFELLDVALAELTPMIVDRVRAYYATESLMDGSIRAWMICGVTHMTLSRALSYATGIPIGKDLKGEHLSLETRCYVPSNLPEEQWRNSDHTFITYSRNDRSRYYVDAVYPILWGGADTMRLHPSLYTSFVPYDTGEFDFRLESDYRLYRFEDVYDKVAGGRYVMPDCSSLDEIAAFVDMCNTADVAQIAAVWGVDAARIIIDAEEYWQVTAERPWEEVDRVTRPRYMPEQWPLSRTTPTYSERMAAYRRSLLE